MNRIDRLTGTILLLQTHRGLSADWLAAHWEISVRSVYRDLASLAEAGVPIYFCQERQGYALMDGFHLPPIQFTDEEAAALFVGGVVTRSMGDDSLKTPLRSALTKIRSVLPDDSRDYLNGLESSVGVWSETSPTATSSARFMPVQDAVLRRRCIDMEYDTAGRGLISHRTVEPLGLLYYADHWHLIAYCRLRQDFRDFRLDRVLRLTVLEERFNGHDTFRIDTFLEEAIRDCELIPVQLSLPHNKVERFRRELFGTPTSEESLPENRLRLSVLTHSEEWLVDWLLSFGPELTVEAPDSLRRKMTVTATAIANQYI